MTTITVGVLALQGAFYEHLQLLRIAAAKLDETATGSTPSSSPSWTFVEVRTAAQLDVCDGLIIPGGESTAIALVAARSNLLEPLRDFVKVHRKPTWGTCAGLILLSESANRTKKGGQELIGGLDVRVNRNHFGRQVESFQEMMDLPFLASSNAGVSPSGTPAEPYRGVFIRAPVVEKVLPAMDTVQTEEEKRDKTIVAPSKHPDPGNSAARDAMSDHVEVLGKLPGRTSKLATGGASFDTDEDAGDVVAVRQGNVFGTSFHPELTEDSRIHLWWLQQVRDAVEKVRKS